ncbi:hypothetical protein ACIPPJ_29450 [Streptomyces sp. NPDC086091]
MDLVAGLLHAVEPGVEFGEGDAAVGGRRYVVHLDVYASQAPES